MLTVTDYQGNSVNINLTGLSWDDTYAGGSIPSNVSSIPDGPATLQVITATGAQSNQAPVQFVAIRTSRRSPMPMCK